MLIVWLCALFAHNGHAEIVSQIDSDVQCQLCQNTLDGVTGVPTIVYAGQSLVGAQPYENLVQFLNHFGVPKI